MRIASVVLWTNGIVSVFDEDGEQVPRLQGVYSQVADKIREELSKPDLSYGVADVDFKLSAWTSTYDRHLTEEEFFNLPEWILEAVPTC